MTDLKKEVIMEHHLVKRSKSYARNGVIIHKAEIQHRDLNEIRNFEDKDLKNLDQKIQLQFAKWDSIYEKNQGEKLAEIETKRAKEKLSSIEDIMTHNSIRKINFNWGSLKKKKEFEKENPKNMLSELLKSEKVIPKPELLLIPPKPFLVQPKFQPKYNFIENLFTFLKNRKYQKLKIIFDIAYEEWIKEIKRIEEEWMVLKIKVEEENKAAENIYKKRIESAEKQKQNIALKYKKLSSEWDLEKSIFLAEVEAFNLKIEARKSNYLKKNKFEVEFYNYNILKSIEFLKIFPNDFELDYNVVNGILIIEYILPSIEDIPTLKEVRYLSTKNEIREIHLSEPQIKAFYDRTIYNIILGIIHVIFESDIANAIDAVSINGWVNSIDKRTGRRINSCIVSLQTNKSEFIKINLKDVEPKLCFKSLKGVGSSELSNLVAIQPILTINKNDKRFIESKNIDFEETTNLALMDWGDFEHLIRELFQKEFSSNGGEVKVTQASRDGGVDAIAFDPDPIRGGKIIIQAKRYTNVVGVSSVRDLYGTVMNEGATKGILVTTSDYGSDSYMFAKDKPLTLLNGSNLLHLLLKHGQKAKIDIKEAKKIIKEQEKANRHFG